MCRAAVLLFARRVCTQLPTPLTNSAQTALKAAAAAVAQQINVVVVEKRRLTLRTRETRS